MFMLGDRVKYVGRQFDNTINYDSDMVGTVVYVRNREGSQPYAVCFDEKYNNGLHDAYVINDENGDVLGDFYNYDSYDDSYELIEHNGWFVYEREIVLLNNKKGNTKLFREGKQ